jgi:cysteine synthase A
VTGWGTGGTLTGAGEVLKAARPDITIVAAEPEQASMVAGNEWQPHMIQGWTPDFIPAVLNKDVCDQLVSVNQDVAKDTALALARNEGIFAGVSAGATLAAGLQVAQSADKGSVLLVMLPDTGERYLSTFMFADINEGSDDDWLASL